MPTPTSLLRRRALSTCWRVFFSALVLAVPAQGQEGALEDVLGGLGTATVVDPDTEAATDAIHGQVSGRVFDAGTGQPLERVTIVIKWPAPESGSESRQEVQTSDAEGSFVFRAVPSGTYDLSYIKSGYRSATVTGFEVVARQQNRADFPLPPLASGSSEEVLLLDEFVVEAETAAEMMTTLETRLDSDQLLNIMSAEDFSKFAAGDVGEALERVAGINVVEGQFAIIRGLEDRYSSTLYNGAPVPSPDPDRQSVQLDLFPSEVVSNLVVSKTFSPQDPSNSSGGAINVITHQYPEDAFEFKLKAGTGFNENAKDRFFKFDGRTNIDKVMDGWQFEDDPFLDPIQFGNQLEKARLAGRRLIDGSPVGREDPKDGDWFDRVEEILESDYVASIGGTQEFENREFRFKGVLAREKDYSSKFGFRGPLEPRPPIEDPERTFFDFGCLCIVTIPAKITASGDLALGELNLQDGLFDVTISTFEKRSLAYGGLGFDLDDEGNHKIDASVFFVRKEEETIEFKENGVLPGFDYLTAATDQLDGALSTRPDSPLFRDTTTRGSFIARSFRDDAFDAASNGALVFTSFFESTSFQRERDLQVYQLNGDHTFEEFPGLHFSWATNWARTSQEEIALGMKYFFEPCGFSFACDPGETRLETGFFDMTTSFPFAQDALGPGRFAVNNRLRLSANQIEESSRFTRLDADYEIEFTDESVLKVAGGLWYESASRTVESAFLQSPAVADTENCSRATSQFVCFAQTPQALGTSVFDQLNLSGNNIGGLRRTSNESSRDIDAWHIRGKWTLWEIFDALGGVRREKIYIESNNDPFVVNPVTGEPELRLGGPSIFPSRYLFFDRLDNPFSRIEDGVFINEIFPDPPPEGSVFNNELLGLTTAPPGGCLGDDGSKGEITCIDIVDRATLESLVDGTIDERRWLGSAGFTLRPIEGLTLRGGWSETVARPSFREMGYYVSVEPGTDDLIVGNPQLQLSDVESYDVRAEYTWGEFGDLIGISAFKKDIQLPIESVIVRDPTNFELSSSALYRTFFNNPNPADLWGVEGEFRKSMGFLGGTDGPDWLNYLSIGGNLTYIEAEVARTEAELIRSEAFFRLFGGDDMRPADTPLFEGLEKKRRLFNQPEWIANADITFDHPDWGTKFTLAYFRISDVLDAAGTATIAPNGEIIGFTLDRYVDDFSEWRVTMSQVFTLPRKFGELKFSASVKNLLDSTRRTKYDTQQTLNDFVEREFRVGRDYSVSLTYTRTF